MIAAKKMAVFGVARRQVAVSKVIVACPVIGGHRAVKVVIAVWKVLEDGEVTECRDNVVSEKKKTL